MADIKILDGEIFIPLENTISANTIINNDDYDNLTNIFNKNINDFRAVIFQNELLRFFIILKINKTDIIDKCTK